MSRVCECSRTLPGSPWITVLAPAQGLGPPDVAPQGLPVRTNLRSCMAPALGTCPVGVGPVGLQPGQEGYVRIFNKKPHVGRNKRGLDGGEVRSDDLSLGIHVSHLNRPGPGAGGNVENFPGRVLAVKGSTVQTSIHGHPEDLVLFIYALIFYWVVGEVIGCLAVSNGTWARATKKTHTRHDRSDRSFQTPLGTWRCSLTATACHCGSVLVNLVSPRGIRYKAAY